MQADFARLFWIASLSLSLLACGDNTARAVELVVFDDSHGADLTVWKTVGAGWEPVRQTYASGIENHYVFDAASTYGIYVACLDVSTLPVTTAFFTTVDDTPNPLAYCHYEQSPLSRDFWLGTMRQGGSVGLSGYAQLSTAPSWMFALPRPLAPVFDIAASDASRLFLARDQTNAEQLPTYIDLDTLETLPIVHQSVEIEGPAATTISTSTTLTTVNQLVLELADVQSSVVASVDAAMLEEDDTLRYSVSGTDDTADYVYARRRDVYAKTPPTVVELPPMLDPQLVADGHDDVILAHDLLGSTDTYPTIDDLSAELEKVYFFTPGWLAENADQLLISDPELDAKFKFTTKWRRYLSAVILDENGKTVTSVKGANFDRQPR
jgi:hypothetical protein